MEIKVRKSGKPGRYEVVGTDLVIEKGNPPAYRMPQEWCVGNSKTDVLFMCRSREGCINAIKAVLAGFKIGEPA